MDLTLWPGYAPQVTMISYEIVAGRLVVYFRCDGCGTTTNDVPDLALRPTKVNPETGRMFHACSACPGGKPRQRDEVAEGRPSIQTQFMRPK